MTRLRRRRRGTPSPGLRVVAWGTFDLGKPRTRILLRGLRENGVEVIRCHAELWRGIEDKSQVGAVRWIGVALRWLAAYPGLVVRYLLSPRHDLVLVAYPGPLDVLVVAPWARLRRVPVVWDVFIPLYDAVVEDRRLLAPRHPAARLLLRAERAAARRAARVLLDTRAQAEHFRSLHGLPVERVGSVPVGVEPESFAPLDPRSEAEDRPGDEPVTALFYGQMIPLHGIRTVLEAAASPAGRRIRWRIVGEGQEQEVVERALRHGEHPHVHWIRWIPYEQLRDEIVRADVCLGIFGDTPKAARVVPNKVYQVLAVGRPLVTRDGPGIREVLDDGPGVRLVPPGDPAALAAAVEDLARFSRGERHRPAALSPASLTPDVIGRTALDELRRVRPASATDPPT